MIEIILLIVLVLLLLGSLPAWSYSQGWGYGPSGLLTLVLVVLLILFFTGRLHAAEPHQWILDGQYRNATNVGCCGKEHCHLIEDSQIERNVAGALVRWSDTSGSHEMQVPRVAIRPSEDMQEWFCVTGCLFVLPET